MANPSKGRAKTKNAVTGVKARNGANQNGTLGRTEAKDRAGRLALTSRLVALIDREGMVRGVFRQPTEARAFLQEGCL